MSSISRFRLFLQKLNQITNFPLTQTYYLDMGSTFTRVLIDGRVVFNQPTSLVIHHSSNSVVAVGQKATDLRGKLPQTLQLVEPVSRGQLLSSLHGTAFLQTVLAREIHSRQKKTTLTQELMMSAPCQMSITYHQALQKMAANSGLVLRATKDSPTAVFDWYRKQKKVSDQACILVTGGQVSEMSFISRGETVFSQRIMFGGDDVTRALQQAIKQFHQIEVSWVTAENLKKEMINLSQKDKAEVKHAVIKGKHVIENIPTSAKIASKSDQWSMVDICQPQLEVLVEGIELFFQQLPPDLLATTLDTGIFLTGGGSQLKGLAAFLERACHTEILKSQTPDTDVIQGLYAN
jgi:rod shape-determining protein MreB